MVDESTEEDAAERSDDADLGGAASSWQVIAEKRRLREVLDEEIARDTRRAILDSREAGVPTAELAELWGVTVAWIYTKAPVRERKPGKTSKKADKASR